MYCNKCGKEISDTSKFCMYCGNKIIQKTQEQYEREIKQLKEEKENLNLQGWISAIICVGICILFIWSLLNN